MNDDASTPSDPDAAACFAQSYAEAREKFLRASEAQGARIERHIHPTARGATDEELSIDVAVLGPTDAKDALLLSSATHGVEGFCGSGCQVALLGDDALLARASAQHVALVFVHGLNAYGFSHLRRVNEDNVDLNRNFAKFDVELPRNVAYAELHPILLPDTWPPSPQVQQQLGAWIAAHGLPGFQAAVTGGQYERADGMFFGGTGPTWSNRTLRTILSTHAGNRARLAWIDFHTGLGPRGHGEKIYAGRADAAELARARACWGTDVTSFYEGSSASAEVTGFVCSAAYDECPASECTMIALEYGTVPIEHALQALRAEHWLANHPDAPFELRATIKRAFRDAFYVDDDGWKAQVVAQARAGVAAALAFFSSGRNGR